MTQSKFKTLKETFIQLETNKWKHNQELYSKQEISGYDENYMVNASNTFDILGLEVNELLKTAKEAKHWFDNNSWRPNLTSETQGDAYTDYDSASIDSFSIVIEYTEPTNDNVFNMKLKSNTKKYIVDLMFPDAQYPKSFDCNMLKLFEDGTIDWNTFRKITDSNCEI